MAIKQFDPKTNTFKELTDREIKREIMLTLGLDPLSAEDQKIYRRQYDIIRKRVKNYEASTATTQPIKANEVFLRIQRRRLSGKELTAQEQNILNTPAVNTGSYSRRLENREDLARQIGKNNLEREFAGLLNKYTDGRQEYNAWLEEVRSRRAIDIITGEVLSPADLKGKTAGVDYIVEELTNRDIASTEDIKNRLTQIANTLHTEQARMMRAYKNNKTAYARNKDIFYRG